MEMREYVTRDGAHISVRYFEYADGAPLIFDIHGGGFVSGKASADDRLLEDLIPLAKSNAASVEYRYAPEVTFPKASEDCCDALGAMKGDISLSFNRSRVYLMGHSAGANIAAAMVRDFPDTSGVILNYPYLGPASFKRKYKIGCFLRFQLRRFERAYFPSPAERMSSLAFPVFMNDEETEAFPRTFILTCGLDTLRRTA